MKVLDLFKIQAYSGKVNVDTDELANYLLTLDNKRMSDLSNNTRYEDIEVPFTEPIIRSVIDDISHQIMEMMKCDISVNLPIWSIRHGIGEQTYPHTHDHDPTSWAVAYWAKVPEGSGMFEYYPTGTLKKSMKIQPREGYFICIPGTLIHGVRSNTNPSEYRVSMSFNIESKLHLHETWDLDMS